MPSIQVVYFKDDDGSVPVLDWLDGLNTKARAKCAVRLERLQLSGEWSWQETNNASGRLKATSDAVEILHRRYFAGRPKAQAVLEEERADAAVARQIYDLRQEAGLSQRELAKLVGTTASVICRLEDADYEGHSLAMLRRIAAALKRRVEIRFMPADAD